MRTFLCWAPELGSTRETATSITVAPAEGPDGAAESYARIQHDQDPMAEDESIVVHVAPYAVFPSPVTVWRVVVVVEVHLRARPA